MKMYWARHQVKVAAVALAAALLATAAPAFPVDLPPPADPLAVAPAPVLSADDGAAPPNRRAIAYGSVAGTYAFLYGWTWMAWRNHGASNDRLEVIDEGWFGPRTYAGGADKVGHFWAALAMTRGVADLLEWGGTGRGAALLSSAALATGFLTLTEIEDGYDGGYGFSWSDTAANLAGVAAGALLERCPRLDEAIDVRLEYFPSPEFIDSVRTKGPFNASEDYTGQTYFVAWHLASVDALRKSRAFGWTQYLDLALGFRTAHYKPRPEDDPPRRQELFLGVAVNFQRLLDRHRERTVAAGGRPSNLSGGLRFATEILQPPFTVLRAPLAERTTLR